jgi:hypothetical protein
MCPGPKSFAGGQTTSLGANSGHCRLLDVRQQHLLSSAAFGAVEAEDHLSSAVSKCNELRKESRSLISDSTDLHEASKRSARRQLIWAIRCVDYRKPLADTFFRYVQIARNNKYTKNKSSAMLPNLMTL